MMFIWTISDVVNMLLFALFFLAALCFVIPFVVKQWRCQHDGGVTETSACDAICQKCGANLGFIGTWREKHKS